MAKVQVLEVSSKEELAKVLSALENGTDPREVIESLTAAKTEEEEESCECIDCTKAELAARIKANKVAMEKAIAEDNLPEMIKRVGEIAAIAKKIKGFEELGKSDPEVEAVITKVHADLVGAGIAPRDEKEFRIYAGMVISSLFDIGLLQSNAE